MATLGRQIGGVAVRAMLHRIGGAVSVDVTILLLDAASSGAAGNTHLHHLAADLATAKRGLAVMQADAALLQRRVMQYQTEAETWQARAERALRAGDAPLARQALARKLQLHRVAAQYTDAQTAQQRSLDQVQAVVEQLEARLRAERVGRMQGWIVGSRRRDTWAARSQATVDAQWEQFELDQAMDALRRKLQSW